MQYRMLALDMDDTLLGHDLQISERTVEAIRQAKTAGVHVVISSGRMFRAILPYFRQLELTDPAIVYNGAMVCRPDQANPLVHYTIPLELARQVAKRIEEFGSQVNVYIDDWLYVREQTPEVLRYMEKTRVDSTSVGPIATWLQVEPTKLLVIHDHREEIEALRGLLKAEFGNQLSITQSKPYFIEIMAQGISKGRTLAKLAQQLGVHQREVIAVGDGLNDLEMVQWAGLGVAVANAIPKLHEVADYVTTSCDEEGVVKVIERFILQRG